MNEEAGGDRGAPGGEDRETNGGGDRGAPGRGDREPAHRRERGSMRGAKRVEDRETRGSRDREAPSSENRGAPTAENREAPTAAKRSGRTPLDQRFRRSLASDASRLSGKTLLVGVSGGLDSTVLLHLLRFTPGLPPFRLCAAHFDHGMRAGSAQDAQWVRGLCHAWEIPLREGRAETALSSEEEARDARYEFLMKALEQEGAGLLLTGHHADDQAETVLFRILRGTGLRGLAGIPRTRAPGILRPLLSFPRNALEDYAESRRIRYREDPTNRDLSFARNQLRLSVLPRLEDGPAPLAREHLRRLARLARENEEAWRSLMPALLSEVLHEKEGTTILLRDELLALHPGVRGRVLREVMRGLGFRLGEVGTRTLLEFTRTGASGRELSLPGGFRIRREFDSFLILEDRSPHAEVPLVVPGPGEGTGRAIIGGRTWRVAWGADEPEGCDWIFAAALESLRFPMRVRRWAPGDRIHLPYGSKKLKKLLLEARVPLSERGRTPLLVDALGRVLWVVGVRTSDLARAPGGADRFFVGMSNVHQP